MFESDVLEIWQGGKQPGKAPPQYPDKSRWISTVARKKTQTSFHIFSFTSSKVQKTPDNLILKWIINSGSVSYRSSFLL